MFTTLTLTASSIMFRDYLHQGAREIAGQACGFVTILAGVFTLHVTKDHGDGVGGLGNGNVQSGVVKRAYRGMYKDRDEERGGPGTPHRSGSARREDIELALSRSNSDM
jgi:hypothetical protein